MLIAGLFAALPFAFAQDVTPAAETDAGSEETNQVLEIPQQCGQDAIAASCDRSYTLIDPNGAGSLSSTPSTSESDPLGLSQDDPSRTPSTSVDETAYGSISDYENQFEAPEPALTSGYVPMPMFVPVPVVSAYSYGMPWGPVVVPRPVAPRPVLPRPRFIRPGGGRGRR